ncbi:hypothetical protein ACFLTE_09780, partial [Bacteroidota bacterium]
LINLLQENASFSLTEDFENFKNNIVRFYDTFQSELNTLSNNIEILDISSNSLNFPLNTISQNLLTFDFLISNYNIFHTSQTKYTVYIHRLIQKTKIQFDKLINLIDVLSNKTELIRHKADDLNDSIQLAQEKLNIELNESKNLLKLKKEKAVNKLKEIEQKSSLSKNINDIITNLQYHDILRQKMEHIQKIHNDVIEKLQIFEKTDKNIQDPKHTEECMLYIKEISELQSAQLLHINKKYQVAINIISENIHKIGENVNGTNAITQDALGYTSKNNSNFLYNLTQNIDSIYKKFQEIFYVFIELTSSLREFKNLHEEFIHGLNLIVTYLNSFSDLSDNFIQALNNEENSDIKSQFQNLFKDITNSKKEIDNQLKQTINIIKNIQSNNTIIKLIEEAQNNFLVFSDVFIQKLKIHSREANQKLLDNKNLCRSITSNIQHTLKQVKYYEYFEQIIEAIINELNTLNRTITKGIGKDKLVSSEKLKSLKKHYTTGSEHDIHDIFIEQGLEQTSGYEDDSEDDDNIELF